MLVIFRAPRGSGPNKEGFQHKVEMPLVPRLGENVNFNDSSYRVHVVEWYPFGDEKTEPYVYVVIRDS